MRPRRLDERRCDGCRICDAVCGRGIFLFQEGKATYSPEGRCIDCGHCMAVCPKEALVRADGSLPPSFDPGDRPSTDGLLHFLRSRRSTRRYKTEAPDRKTLERLVDAARFAPTGTNKQEVKIVMVSDPELLKELRGRIMARYAQYERHLSNAVKRFLLKTFVDKRLGDPAIRAYLHGFMEKYRDGRDPLFHFAPTVAVLHAGKAATTAKDDCVLALYQMVLVAETLGLGSCLLGTVETAFSKTPELNDLLGIPRNSPVLAAACFGYPAIPFKRLTDRNPPSVRWL